LFNIGTFFSGLAISLYFSWPYTLWCLLYIPLMMVVFAIMGSVIKKAYMEKFAASLGLNGRVEEMMHNVKLIVAFANEDVGIDNFAKHAEENLQISLKAAKKIGMISGFFFTIMMGFQIYAYYIALFLVRDKWINPNTGVVYDRYEVIICIQGMMMAMVSCGSIVPILPAIINALIAARRIFDVIERKSEIEGGKVFADTQIELKNAIYFEKAVFRYPQMPESAPDVLNGATFKIKAGTSTAIVGPSGSGKSTIVQLVNNFYNLKEGTVHFDETNLKEIELKSLRKSIGYVSQEPVLILGTIRDNLRYGDKDASEENMQDALT